MAPSSDHRYRRRLVPLLIVTAALALAATAAIAQEGVLPSPRQSGAVVYLTGGVSQEESTAFQAASSRYPLSIQLIQVGPSGRGEFTAGAHVRVTNSAGVQVLDANADGPYMLVQFPPGRYTVQASLNERALPAQAVTIGDRGHADVWFRFPGSGD